MIIGQKIIEYLNDNKSYWKQSNCLSIEFAIMG